MALNGWLSRISLPSRAQLTVVAIGSGVFVSGVLCGSAIVRFFTTKEQDIRIYNLKEAVNSELSVDHEELKVSLHVGMV